MVYINLIYFKIEFIERRGKCSNKSPYNWIKEYFRVRSKWWCNLLIVRKLQLFQVAWKGPNKCNLLDNRVAIVIAYICRRCVSHPSKWLCCLKCPAKCRPVTHPALGPLYGLPPPRLPLRFSHRRHNCAVFAPPGISGGRATLLPWPARSRVVSRAPRRPPPRHRL